MAHIAAIRARHSAGLRLPGSASAEVGSARRSTHGTPAWAVHAEQILIGKLQPADLADSSRGQGRPDWGRPSTGELGLLVQPGELVWVTHGEDPRDPPVLDDDANDRGAAHLVLDPHADSTVEPDGPTLDLPT